MILVDSTNHLVQSTDVVRTLLPSIIPPSYRGATIRYIYYVESTLSGQQLMLDNTNSHRESSKDLIQLVGLLKYRNCFLRFLKSLSFISLQFCLFLSYQKIRNYLKSSQLHNDNCWLAYYEFLHLLFGGVHVSFLFFFVSEI